MSCAGDCYKLWLPWNPTYSYIACNHVSPLVATFCVGWYLGEGLIQFWLLQGGMVEGVGQSYATFWQCREDCHVHTGISSGLGCNYHLHNWRDSIPIINVHYLQRGTASFPGHFLQIICSLGMRLALSDVVIDLYMCLVYARYVNRQCR